MENNMNIEKIKALGLRDTTQPSLRGKLVSVKELVQALVVAGAEKDDEGRFKIYPVSEEALPPQFLLGVGEPDNDVLITEELYAVVNGDPMILTNLPGLETRSSLLVIY
jgi:hypothetical protein